MARSMARALRLNEDLAEAIALSHDLGHTPFGHAGERVLDEKLIEVSGFDHNIQALRVVTLLENRYAEHDGLNLSWETLEGILKHNGPLVDADGQPLGRYRDTGLPSYLLEVPGADGLEMQTFASLEAQCAAIADDVAYNAHDIDDALRAGLLSLDDLGDVPLVGPIVREVQASYPDVAPKRQAHEVQRRLITRQIEDVIKTTEFSIADEGVATVDDVRLAGQALVRFSVPLAEAEKALKSFLFAQVYRSDAVMAPVLESQRLVSALYERYIETGDMPGRWGKAAATASNEAARARIVGDFIAGMTDPYAIDEYARLFDARPVFS
ncbi:deoxyguanosinetriphosphate triphosphohydrolase-like protein [Devosia pacifica]|uniref:Deoxyguanosinetriphosphate triphosphohydrolase-like protein n=2 Tax=Devosia pacifica TaxID=1335967 RepID=A0A918VLG5_9HYPH|nr:deoxyguanosinetriphosphate triphosphohydrolase-like protein [Devosia pacifica]